MSAFSEFPVPAGGPNLESTASWLERELCTGGFAARVLALSLAIGIVFAWMRMRTRFVYVELKAHQHPSDKARLPKTSALEEVVIVSSDPATSNRGLSTSTQTSQILPQPRNSLNPNRDFPHTCAEREHAFLTRLILCKEEPNTFTGIGGQFANINTRKPDTNIWTIEDDSEEIDLDLVEALNEDSLSSLMRKHEENVWDFMSH